MLAKLRGKLLVKQREKDQIGEKLEALDTRMKELEENAAQIRTEGQKLMVRYGAIQGIIDMLGEMIEEEQNEPDDA